MMLSDQIDLDAVWLATGPGVERDIYHTDPHCRAIRRAAGCRKSPTDALHDRRECKICSGEAATAPVEGRRRTPTCLSCGDTLNDDGTCAFCEAFDSL